jgi:PAS domain S-box-containing protein
MSWTTAIWSVLIGLCVAMAAPQLVVGIWQRRIARLFFVAMSVAVIGVALCELNLMHAGAIAEAKRIGAWLQLPLFLLFVTNVGFVAFYFRTATLWLGVTTCAVRCISLVGSLATPAPMGFREITGLHYTDFLGERIAVPVGQLSLWAWVAKLTWLLLLVYVLDASIRLWRQRTSDSRRRALIVGGSLSIANALGTGFLVLFQLHAVSIPYVISIAFTVVLAAMAFDLSWELFLAQRIAERLVATEASVQESEARFRRKEQALREVEDRVTLAAEAAHLGVWEFDITKNKFWFSDKARSLFYLDRDKDVSFDDFQALVHPDDRAEREAAIKHSIKTGEGYEIEYRIVLPDGAQRWMASRGRCLSDAQGKFTRLVGVSADVTERRQAQDLFRLAIEASPSGILLVNEDGKIVLVNAHMEELFGYRRDELVGKKVELLVPERFLSEHESLRTAYVNAGKEPRMEAGRELFARRKDGIEFPVEISLNPIQKLTTWLSSLRSQPFSAMSCGVK